MTQILSAKQSLKAAPATSECFPCAAAASLILILSALSEISLGVLIVPVAVAAISLIIRLALTRRSPHMERA